MYDIIVDLLVDIELTFKKALTNEERSKESKLDKNLRHIEEKILNNRLLKDCDNKKLKLKKLWDEVVKEFAENPNI